MFTDLSGLNVKYQVIEHQHIFQPEVHFPCCHASTICRLPDQTLGAARFAGEREGAADVAIWFTKRECGNWNKPRKIADQEGVPCWNPVLYVIDERLLLFYKVGKKISRWQTIRKESNDSGKTWSVGHELVPGDYGGRGPVKNKCIILSDSSILAPASTEDGDWKCFVDITEDGIKWRKSENVPLNRSKLNGTGFIQPTLWQDEYNTVHMLMRSSEGAIYQSNSKDWGYSWSPALRTSLPNNNCGIDLARLQDGELVLVYNPISGNWAARSCIAFCVSVDNGKTWSEPEVLDYIPYDKNEEWAEFSYPAIIAEGKDVFITYTWKRKTISFWQIRIF